jgi:hypothetical protein
MIRRRTRKESKKWIICNHLLFFKNLREKKEKEKKKERNRGQKEKKKRKI